MQTVRLCTFETNSSSAHCFVTADNEAFARFVKGDLFADGLGYKYRYNAVLIDEDAAYGKYENYYVEDIAKYSSDAVKLSKDTVLWFLRNPDEIEPITDDYSDVVSVVSMPQHIKDECNSNSTGVRDLLCWMNLDIAPLSYATLVKETSNFENGYDGYDSEPPTEKDGKTSCYAVWYY